MVAAPAMKAFGVKGGDAEAADDLRCPSRPCRHGASPCGQQQPQASSDK